MNTNYGIKKEANAGRELYQDFNNKRYARFPIETPLLNIGDNLMEFIEKYGVPYYKKGDLFCISSKIISIGEGLVTHISKIKVSPLAKLIVKFVKKWPNDYGYSRPEKMQVAINIVGYPRMILALIGGTLMKLIGKPGYFYIIAGNRINAIDGFIPTAVKPFNEYAFLPPMKGDEIAERIQQKFEMATVIIDGNNIDNNIIGRSSNIKNKYSIPDLMRILKGNPQGQDDDGNITPLLLIREVKKNE